MWFLPEEKIGLTRYRTPEGFLVCESVPIARTGIMAYGPGEIPIEPGTDGIIRIERSESDVFDPKTIASFAGKPVTDDHPDEDVTPANWSQLAKGEIHNPRRGDGIWSDCLVADLFIKDENAIQIVLDGKVEVSCGYDADYEQIAPGRGRQHNIIGNHVALVENGRCGPRCSIGDKSMTAKKSFADRIRAAFKARDVAEEELEEALKEGVPAGEEANGATHVHVHLNGGETKAVEAEKAADEGEPADPIEARFGKIEAAITAIAEQVGKLVQAEKAEAEVTNADEDPEKKEGDDATKDEDVLEEGDVTPAKTADAAGLASEFTDTIARIEILLPGTRVPTFDAKADAKKVRDNLCALRRRAMTQALDDSRASAFVKPFAKDAAAIKAMTCDAAKTAFIAASEVASVTNNFSAIGADKATRDASNVGVKSIADINKAHRDFWAARS
ncbi:DUF2213 domain-containing protein [Kaistia dalseonensis]|uniref:DUF2213 domain-containing protein n=1 Tax=Kaistia dalseonensis TaxID=410840 RepID=A0ABU0H922_9HYPH|nr:DUF2213 domain-containing protein [Kaistia dalseonensis]MCX5495379.1 DUF2213 domain-containing protein [Kaistia dalseonensis]MDQ0437966.1 hypothetical protein [Kaistia dalseonensis]